MTVRFSDIDTDKSGYLDYNEIKQAKQNGVKNNTLFVGMTANDIKNHTTREEKINKIFDRRKPTNQKVIDDALIIQAKIEITNNKLKQTNPNAWDIFVGGITSLFTDDNLFNNREKLLQKRIELYKQLEQIVNGTEAYSFET